MPGWPGARPPAKKKRASFFGAPVGISKPALVGWSASLYGPFCNPAQLQPRRRRRRRRLFRGPPLFGGLASWAPLGARGSALLLFIASHMGVFP